MAINKKKSIRVLSVLSLLLSWNSFAASAAETVPVTAVSIDSVRQVQSFDAPAEVVALNAPDLSAQLSAVIESIPVRVGDHVKAGDRLVSLNCDLFLSRQKTAAAELQRADAQRQFAQAQLRRAKNLSNSKSISEELLNQRETELLTSAAEYRMQQEQSRQAEIDVSYCNIDAPFAAVVTARLQDVGALAVPGTALISLVQLDDVEVKAQLRETELRSLAAARDIRFIGDTGSYPLQLRAAAPVLDVRSRTRDVRLSFTAEQAIPGSAGRLYWQNGDSTLSANYLVRRDGRLGVFLLKDDHAVFHVLEDAIEGQPAAIDLPEGTLVIVEGRQRLQDGDAVSLSQSQVEPN